MELLKIKSKGTEMEVYGTAETIGIVSKNFCSMIVQKESDEINTDAPQNCGISDGVALSTTLTVGKLWDELLEDIHAGKGPTIGEKLNFTLKSGEPVTFVVTQDTEEYIRFDAEDCIGGEYIPWNKKNTNRDVGNSYMQQKYLNDELLKQFPEELQEAICETTRKYLDSDGQEKEYKTLLFLPSAAEVFDEDNCYGDNGLYEQLTYYKNRRNRVKNSKKDGGACHWWLSSPYASNSTYFCYVYSSGAAHATNASSTYGVAPCFLIPKSK